MTPEYWFMLPVSVIFATIAMASGVEGATFFTPMFILALGLPPEIAIGTGLITEVFGFASGLFAYARKRTIDYKLGIALLLVTIPLSLLGTVLGGYVPATILKTILGMGLITIALTFLKTPNQIEIKHLDENIYKEYGGDKAQTSLTTSEGEEIRYTVCNKNEGRIYAGIGSLFIGMISTGLGELNGYFLLQRCRVPSRIAVATSVFIVAITALVASVGHFYKFVQSGGETLNIVLSLVVFTVPGVIIGGQLGSLVSSRISQHYLEKGLAILFIIVAVLMLSEVIL